MAWSNLSLARMPAAQLYEAIGEDLGLGRIPGRNRAVQLEQIDTYSLHFLPAIQGVKISAEKVFAASERNVVDLITLDGGGALLMVKEVLVNAQDPRAVALRAFPVLRSKAHA